MPKFIDYHSKMPEMPPEAFAQMKDAITSGKPDQFGSIPLNVFMGVNGDAYCLSESPSIEALCQSHAAVGVAILPSDVQEVRLSGVANVSALLMLLRL